MATKLTKTLSRQMLGDPYGKSWIVSLEAGDDITFRLKGKRTRYTVSLAQTLVLALFQYNQDIFNKKMAEYKAGARRRKPVAPRFTHAAPIIRGALVEKSKKRS